MSSKNIYRTTQTSLYLYHFF